MKLERLQKWMQAVVVHPGSTHKALRSPGAAGLLPGNRIGTVLLPSPTLTPAQRIGVYQEMYPLRMYDALAADYPGLEHFLGDRFRDFVSAYTSAHPSMGYTLNRLGDHVPAFLARQRKFSPRPFLVDLARLELALTQAFDERESPTLKAEAFEGLSSGQLEKTRLVPVPSLRLVRLSWNVDAYLDSTRDDEHKHPKPRRESSFVIVFRRNYAIYRLPVSAAAFALLDDIVAGETLGAAVTNALGRRGVKRASVDEFAQWFKNWTTEGVFAGVRKKKPKKRD